MAVYVYLETAPGSGLFNLRGEVGAGDNPDSFARMMLNRQGLRSAFPTEVITADDGGTKNVSAARLGVE